MTIEFNTSPHPVPYPDALAWMEQRVEAIAAGTVPDCIWCLEHPPLYTAGSSAKPEHLLNHDFPTYSPGRGGQWTYHGPGQVVAYVMMDLKKLYAPQVPDLRDFIRQLERWIIATLSDYGVHGKTIEGRTGVWVGNAKIAAIGVRVRHGVSYHGISINVHPDLSHYAGIVPCGIDDAGVTSLQACGKDTLPAAVIASLQAHIDEIYA